MKKIVALVLSLVMVLGLATVAFADTTTTTLDGEDYAIYGITGTDALENYVDHDIVKTVTDKQVVSVGTVTTTTYTATTYAIEDPDRVWAEVDSSVATAKLVKGNTVVAFLARVTGDVPTTDVVVDEVVASVKVAAKATCGDYVNELGLPVYVVDDEAYFAGVGTGNWAVLNGKFVELGAAATPEVHALAVTAYNADDAEPAVVTCSVCKKSFNVLDANAVKTMAPAAYAYDADLGLFYATGAVVADAAEGDKVESAETFDAGIAMYVGMSVMAAAGSAVVLKKKD